MLISQSYGAGRLGRTRVVSEQTLVFKVLVALAAKFGFQIPLLLLMQLAFRASIQVVWLSFLGTEAIEAAVVFLYYRAGRWKTVRL